MEKYNDARGFRNIRMNLDAAPEALEANEYREIFNMIEENTSGKLVNMKGFESVMALAINSSFSLPAGTFKCIGSRRDIEENTIIYCLCDTAGTNHSILQMNTETKVLEWILKSERYLNFKSDHRVSVKVIEGLLYLTDGYFGSFLGNDFNPPRKINIEKAKKFTTAFFGTQVQYINGIGKATVWPFNAPLFISSDGNPHTTYRLTSQEYKYTVGDKVVTWIEEGDAWGYRYRPATGYGTVIERFIHQGIYYLVIDRAWTETVNSIQKTGHILPYSADMYFGIDWQVLDVIKWPPNLPPSASYNDDSSQKINKLRNNLFQFCYRWVYDDNEKSVFSPISNVPLPSKPELLNGAYDETELIDNVINIWVDTGSLEVREVEIAMRIGNIGNWTIINNKYKYDDQGLCVLTNDIYSIYQFYNNETGQSLDQTDVARPYDFVPLTAKRQEIIEKNRLLYGDYREGFDNTAIDVGFSVTSVEKETRTFTNEVNNFVTKKIAGALIGDWENPLAFIYGGAFNFEDIGWETGYTYVVYISGIPYTYNNPENLYLSPSFPEAFYLEWFDKIINASAVVDTPAGTTFEDFINSVVAQLRVITGYSSVIGINRYAYKTFGICSEIYDIYGGPGTEWLKITELGFIIELRMPFNECVVCPVINFSVYKIPQISIYKSFKSGAYHPFGFVYKERGGRRGAVNISDESIIYINSQAEGGSHKIYVNSIGYSISHSPPDWATHLQMVYAKNSSIGYFLWAAIADIENIYASKSVAVEVNSYIVQTNEEFTKFEIGAYIWESGDRVRFLFKQEANSDYKTFGVVFDSEIIGTYYPDGDESYLMDDSDTPIPIVDVNGNKVKDIQRIKLLVPRFDYQSYGINKDDTIVEIYRPLKTTENVLYYDFGQPLKILDPHTTDRRHSGGLVNQLLTSPASGILTDGDIFVVTRSMQVVFPCERSNYSDFYPSEAISIGIPNAVNRDMYMQEYISKFIFSGKLIQNTRINSLSSFISSDSVDLQDKFGAIYDMQEVGFTLKILQKSKPSSLYIGRAGVTQPSEQSTEILTSTKDVLGTLIVHPSDFGTVHPDSYVKNENRYYFFDFYAYALCRDANNGIQNISEAYNINSFLKEKCRLFGSADNVDVVGAYDQANELVFWTFTDKTTSANSFTIGFRDTGGRNQDGFALFAHFLPDYYGVAKQTLTSFNGNTLWLHNSDTAPRVNFYGVQYKYWFTMVFNKLPLIIKRILTIFVASDKKFSAPDAGDISIPPTGNNPNGMVSLLKAGAFESVQGKWIAEFGKNMTTNQDTATVEDLVNGDDLEGQTVEVRLEGDETTEHKVFSVEIEGVTTKP